MPSRFVRGGEEACGEQARWKPDHGGPPLRKGMVAQKSREWIEDELAGIDLGDERLNKRCGRVLERLAADPQASINGACHGWAETHAAYQFFDHDAVDEHQSPGPAPPGNLGANEIVSRGLARSRHHRVGLHADQEETGRTPDPWINSTDAASTIICKWPSRRSVFAWAWCRCTSGHVTTKPSTPASNANIHRWKKRKVTAGWKVTETPVRSPRSCRKRKSSAFRTARAIFTSVFWRPNNRVRPAGPIGSSAPARIAASRSAIPRPVPRCYGKLFDAIAEAPVLGKRIVRVPKTSKHKARKAKVTIRAQRIRLKPPYRPGVRLPELEINVILVKEETPPDGEEPIVWLLLTSLPIDRFAEVLRVVDYYTCRWQIEVYFRVFKIGCRWKTSNWKRRSVCGHAWPCTRSWRGVCCM